MPVDPAVAPHTAPATSRHYLPLLQHTNFALNRDFCPWANRWVYWLKRPVWGLSVVRGFAVQDATDTAEGVSLARVHGWSTAEYSWPFVPQIRGKYPLTAPEVETGFPFGLYRATRRATVDGYVVVWPKTVMLSGLPDAAETRPSDEQLADRRLISWRVTRISESHRQAPPAGQPHASHFRDR